MQPQPWIVNRAAQKSTGKTTSERLLDSMNPSLLCEHRSTASWKKSSVGDKVTKEGVEAFSRKLEAMKVAGTYDQWREDLRKQAAAFERSPIGRLIEATESVKRNSYLWLLRQNWLAAIFPRSFRLHRRAETTFMLFLNEPLHTWRYGYWCRYNNRLSRLVRRRNPWREE